MRDEIVFRQKFLEHWVGQCSKIEPNIGSTDGIPDTFLVNTRTDGWIEFKMAEDGGKFSIRPSQRHWHLKYSSFRPNSAFCVMSPIGFWLLPSAIALNKPAVVGEPVEWALLKPLLASAVVEAVFTGMIVNKKLVDDAIDPVIKLWAEP